MSKVHREACIRVDWHYGHLCGYEDVRRLATSFVVVDERFRAMPVQVKHEVILDTTVYPPERFATAFFKLEGVINRKPDIDRSVIDNNDLYGPPSE